MADYWTEL